MDKINETSLDTLCAALAYAMGIKAPEFAATQIHRLRKACFKFEPTSAQTVIPVAGAKSETLDSQ